MTLPWYLNPWAEVRRLRGREELAASSFDVLFSDYQKAQFYASSLESENADLRRRIAEMNSCESGAGNCGFLRNSPDLIQRLEAAAKRQITAEEIEIQRQNYALSFKRTES